MRAACRWAACDGKLMQKLANAMARRVSASVVLLTFAVAVGPALAQSPRSAQTPSRPGQPAAAPQKPAEPANIDAGKNGEQLFKANCTVCHKSAAGLSRAGGILGVQNFLRSHYTASRESANEIAAYLSSVDTPARPADRPARRTTTRPDARPTKKDESGAPETKPAEAKPAQASSEERPRPPASPPAAESKPAEPQAAAQPATQSSPPPAAPAEQKPADAPKAE